MIGAPVGLGRDEYACVQILARPVTGRRVARARRSARRVHTGSSTRVVGRLLDLLTPGVKTGRARNATKSGALDTDPQTALEYAAHNRAIVAKQRRLVLQRCTNCRWFNNPPRIICPQCQGEDFEWSEVSGKATIFTFTVTYQTTVPGFSDELPYVIVHAGIDEQPACIITANLVGPYEADKLDINLPVVVDWEDRGDMTLPMWRLA